MNGNPRPDFESLYLKWSGRPRRQTTDLTIADRNRPKPRETVGAAEHDAPRRLPTQDLLMTQFGYFREDSE